MADADLIIDAKVVTTGVDKGLKKTQSSIGRLTKQIVKFGAAAAAAVSAFSVKAFADYEKALVGLGKTSDIQGKQLDQLGERFKRLSERIPVSTNELLNLGKTAAQLGVSGEKNILRFTETLAKLSSATDIVGEKGATDIAILLQNVDDGVQNIEKFGAAIVELGNNFAATESRILSNATEIGKAIGVYGVGSKEILGLATATAASGIQAEVSRTAFLKTFKTFEEAARGGSGLSELTRITQLTAEEFKRLQKENPTELFLRFSAGLKRLSENGESATAILDGLSLSEIRTSTALLQLANNADRARKAVETGNEAFEKGTALNEEAQRAYDTLGSKAILLGNTIINTFTSLTKSVAEDINFAIDQTRFFLVNNRKLFIDTFIQIREFVTRLILRIGDIGDAFKISSKDGVSFLSVIRKVFEGFGRLIENALSGLAAIGRALNDTGRTGQNSFTLLLDIIGGVVDVVSFLADKLANLPRAFATGSAVVAQLIDKLKFGFESLGLTISETFAISDKEIARIEKARKLLEIERKVSANDFADTIANIQEIDERRLRTGQISATERGLESRGIRGRQLSIDEFGPAIPEGFNTDKESNLGKEIEQAKEKLQQLKDEDPQAYSAIVNTLGSFSPEQAEADLAGREQQDEARLQQQSSFLDSLFGLEQTNTKKRAGLKDDLTAADKKANESIVAQNLGAANQILGIFSENSKSVAKVQQGLNLGLTIADTAVNAVKAFQSQLIAGDPTSVGRAFAAAAAAIAQGAAQQGVVKGAFKGFETGGIAMGNEPFIVGEAGPEIVVPSSNSSRVLNNLQSRNVAERVSGNSQQPINVNISAEGNIDDIIGLINFRIREQDRADIS